MLTLLEVGHMSHPLVNHDDTLELWHSCSHSLGSSQTSTSIIIQLHIILELQTHPRLPTATEVKPRRPSIHIASAIDNTQRSRFSACVRAKNNYSLFCNLGSSHLHIHLKQHHYPIQVSHFPHNYPNRAFLLSCLQRGIRFWSRHFVTL